jgi:hypothetical protein
MILYSLKCTRDHGFDSWFANAEAFADLLGKDQITCPVCGTSTVAKSLMAPRVRPARTVASVAAKAAASGKGTLSEPRSDIEAALAEMRKQVETNSDYVGVNFVAEARKMHEGAVPERSIYGEARLEDAKALIEEGVKIAPLPFMPARKTN